MSKRVWFAALAALIASLGVTGPALAQGVAPAVLPMQGFLTDGDGTPIDGDISLRINLYDSEVATTDIFTETQTVMVDQGHFVAYVGDAASLDLALFRDNSDVWVGLAIDGGTELPRFQLGSVPYAGFAQYAGAAGNALQLAGAPAADYALAAATQARVTGTCPSGQAITAVNSDGTVACAAVGAGTLTGVSGAAGSGITGGGTSGAVTLNTDSAVLQRRVTGTCPNGGMIRSISATGTVSCGHSGMFITNQWINTFGNNGRCGFANTTPIDRTVFVYTVCASVSGSTVARSVQTHNATIPALTQNDSIDAPACPSGTNAIAVACHPAGVSPLSP